MIKRFTFSEVRGLGEIGITSVEGDDIHFDYVEAGEVKEGIFQDE